MTYTRSFCPICKTALDILHNDTHNKYMPFCSSRCQQIDLGAWAKEEYRVPTKQVAHTQEEYEEE